MACHLRFFVIIVFAQVFCGPVFASISYIQSGGFSNTIAAQVAIAPSPAPSASPGTVGGVVAFPRFYFSNISTTTSGAAPNQVYVDGGGAGCSPLLNANCKNAGDTFSITVASSAPIANGNNFFYFIYVPT